jgi:hypothetical protein
MSTVFNVERFKSALTNGGVRPNQFAVQISFPTYVAEAAQAVASSPFLINIAELPGQVVNPAVVLYRGREVKFAGDRIYAPWATTILNDSNFSLRNGIEQWMQGMEEYQTKIGRLNPAAYQRNIDVFQLDRNGNILKSYTLLDAFPVDLSPVALDFGANDQISTFTCTWQYQSFTTSGASGSLGNILGTVFNAGIV